MKTFKKTLLAAAMVTTGVTGVTFGTAANAEVSGSVAIASSYLWRGFELGSGAAVVSGSLDYASDSGFYAGIWGSSGDSTAGTEYDLYAGYGGSAGDFSYDVSLISYVYPTGQFSDSEGPGDFMEAIISVGYGDFALTYHDNIAGETGGYAFDEDYGYVNLSVGLGQFGIALGKHLEDAEGGPGVTGDATHLDLTYSYTDNLSFTFSAIVDSDFADSDEPEPTFVVAYSLPLE